ncbi:MAG TPA: diguanylate cyclase, partial [Planctomycetota bacterium]|nr:diguanylate cyclase [Planctomycetota bacterium]
MSEPFRLPDDPAFQDALTGLPNRRALLAALRERVPTGRGALILLDLDHWKKLGERLAKVQIDPLLADVAGRLREAAGSEGLLCRYAVDAFAVLLPGADRDRGAAAAEALRTALAASPFRLAEAKGATMAAANVTATAAAAEYPLDGRSPMLLIETTELALMVAKHAGRNRVAVAGRLDPNSLAEIGVFRGLPCPVLVGRVEEQARLRQLAGDVRHVGPKLVLVSAPPGSGKTRLLRELTVWARSERFVLLTAIAQEARAGLPYAVLTEAVENLLYADRAQALAAVERLAPEHRSALSVLIRDFPSAGPPAGLDVAGYGRRIFDAWGALLEELSRVGPLLLVVDEIEHADAASLDVVGAATARRLPLCLASATAAGPAELGVTAAGDFFRGRGKSFERVTLGPLAAEDVEKAVHAILPAADAAPGSVKQLVEAARGNLLHLEETLRSLLLRGRIRQEGGRWTIPPLDPAELPKDLDTAVRAVADALPPRANALLARAAVLGPHVDPELLQEVLGQDDMEMLDLLDEARRARLLAASDAGSETLTFPAQHARKVRYESAQTSERQEIHRRVGVVQEARHAGDVAHLAGELAYHYERGGVAPRAQHFAAMAERRAAVLRPPVHEGARRARLESIKEALSPQALVHAGAVLRNFLGALRIGRLYPGGSQVSATFVTQLKQSMRALLDESPGLTFAVTPSGPTLNGAATDLPAAGEFAALLEERLLESVTCLKVFDPDRLPEILEAFGQPFNPVAAPANHWDLFLERKAIEGFDLVQRAYQARDRQRAGALLRAEEPLPQDAFPALLSALRALKAAVENLRLYPPGHSLVEETTETAATAMKALLERVPAVTLGAADKDLVVNGAPGDRKFFGDVGAFVVKEIGERGYWSLTLGKGLKPDEIRTLCVLLATPAGQPVDHLLSQLTHVQFGSLQYERAVEGDEAVVLEPPPKPTRSEIRAREMLAVPYAEFLSRKMEEAFAVLVETLAVGARRPLAEQLVDRLGEHFNDPDLKHRRKAYDLLARSIAFASPSCRQVQIARTGPPIKKRLLEDDQPPFFRAAADILPIWFPAAASSNCLREFADLAGPVLRKRADAPETPREIAAAAEGALQLIPNTGAYPVLLAAIRRPKQDERLVAMGILLAIGGQAVQRLVESMVDEPDLAARQSAAMALSLAPGPVVTELLRVLSPDA